MVEYSNPWLRVNKPIAYETSTNVILGELGQKSDLEIWNSNDLENCNNQSNTLIEKARNKKKKLMVKQTKYNR